SISAENDHWFIAGFPGIGPTGDIFLAAYGSLQARGGSYLSTQTGRRGGSLLPSMMNYQVRQLLRITAFILPVKRGRFS
ncbi:MAG: hypothetical protein ACQEQG_06350, partial [Bacillota bacterium]